MKESSSKILQEIHTNRNMSNTKTWLGIAFYTQGKLETQNVLNNIGLSWKFAEKNVRPDFWLIEPKLQSIEKGWNSFFNPAII